MANDVKTKKQYDVYFKKMRKENKQPMTFYHWKKSGRTSPYFRGLKRATRPGAYYSRSDRKVMGMED